MNMQSDVPKVVSTTLSPSSGGNQIGALLIDAGKIIPQDAEQILRYAKEHGLRFGEAGIKMGLVTRDDIDRVVARQFDYTYLLPGESAVGSEVIAAYSPFSQQVEALRAVRSQLLLRWVGEDSVHRRVAIVSANRREGRSYLAANLAVVFSQLGERTLLVDADLRHARQHDIFGLSNGSGLSTILSGRAGVEVIQRIPALVALSVLPAGPLPPNPQELLNRGSFATLLSDLAKQYDVVLFDTPAASQAADCQAVAARAGGAMVVTRVNRTRLSQMKSLVEGLAGSGVTVIGTVLNNQ
jgi:protein-tyrosine kinase